MPSRLEEPEPPARLSLPDTPPVEPSPPLSLDEDRATVRGLVAPDGGAALPRRALHQLIAFATGEGARGLTCIKIRADGAH